MTYDYSLDDAIYAVTSMFGSKISSRHAGRCLINIHEYATLLQDPHTLETKSTDKIDCLVDFVADTVDSVDLDKMESKNRFCRESPVCTRPKIP